MKQRKVKSADEISAISLFLSSYNSELRSKVKRLDGLIGRKHWLSVGNYKESILRDLISSAIPKRFEVSTGFVAACSREGELILSRQSDIFIWDSVNYSPIFRDKDFVIIPPESCRVMIEVKGRLTKTGLSKSISNYDAVLGLSKVEFSKYFLTKKLIFAYEADSNLKSPADLVEAIATAYMGSNVISIEERMSHISKTWPQKNAAWPLLSIDGVFVLGAYSTIRRIRQSNEGAKLMLSTYDNVDPKDDHIYAQFEYEIQSSLADDPFNSQDFWYEYQPGLLSIKDKMRVRLTEPENLRIFPPIAESNLHPDLDRSTLYPGSIAKGV